MAEKDWEKLVESAPTMGYRGKLARTTHYLSFSGVDTPSYLFTSGNRNRCNPKGVNCIYMSCERETAQSEFDSYANDAQPNIFYWAEFNADAILNLGDRSDANYHKLLNHFGLSDDDFFKPFRRRKAPTPLESIGAAIARQKRIVGIRFPSAACHRAGVPGFNVVIFKESLTSPDSLRILGPGDSVLEEWP